MNELGERIKMRRVDRGWTQAELIRAVADRGLSWHQQTLHKVETGSRNLVVHEAVILADSLEVSIGWLATGKLSDYDDGFRDATRAVKAAIDLVVAA